MPLTVRRSTVIPGREALARGRRGNLRAIPVYLCTSGPPVFCTSVPVELPRIPKLRHRLFGPAPLWAYISAATSNPSDQYTKLVDLGVPEAIYESLEQPTHALDHQHVAAADAGVGEGPAQQLAVRVISRGRAVERCTRQ